MVDQKLPEDLKLNQKVNELWLQYLWKESDFSERTLFTETGEQLEVVFPGWYNRGWGPDFKESRIRVGGRTLFGDVEVHIDESDWQQHGHHQDEAYNKVILHVFLRKAKSGSKNQLEQPVVSFHLASVQMRSFWENGFSPFQVCIEEMPGACGLLLNQQKGERLKKIIFQAAEKRMVDKAKPFEEHLNEGGDENDLLYTSICRALGYSGHADLFSELSQRYPYSKTVLFFNRLYRQSRVELLSRWFGYLGYLDRVEVNTVGMDFRREWIALKNHWQRLTADREIKKEQKPVKASRPLNHPLRRLVGLYYHLDQTRFQGLLKSWLKYLQECDQDLRKGKGSRKAILERLDDLFPQPEWEMLAQFLSPTSTKPSKNSETRLIGKHRQRVILVNAIIPFFFAWARNRQDKELEKLLFALLLILPGEGENRITRFMEARFALAKSPVTLRRNLSYHQGLIQVYQDCCTSFYEGCDNCTLLTMLE